MKRFVPLLLVLTLLCLAAPAHAQTRWLADSQIDVASSISLNNTTAIIVSARPSTLYNVELSNNSATIAYAKFYNAATQTCGSGTPYARYQLPANATVPVPNVNGDAYSNGIALCITTGIGDSDTGAPAANAYIVNSHYKPW